MGAAFSAEFSSPHLVIIHMVGVDARRRNHARRVGGNGLVRKRKGVARVVKSAAGDDQVGHAGGFG